MKNNDLQFPFNEPEFIEAWDEWISFRRERRLPAYKPTGLKRTFAGLFRDANGDFKTAIKIIHNSIEKNWQGLFPLKSNGTHQQTNGIDYSKFGKAAGTIRAGHDLADELGIKL